MSKDTTKKGDIQEKKSFFFFRRAPWQENPGRFQCPGPIVEWRAGACRPHERKHRPEGCAPDSGSQESASCAAFLWRDGMSTCRAYGLDQNASLCEVHHWPVGQSRADEEDRQAIASCQGGFRTSPCWRTPLLQLRVQSQVMDIQAEGKCFEMIIALLQAIFQ